MFGGPSTKQSTYYFPVLCRLESFSKEAWNPEHRKKAMAFQLCLENDKSSIGSLLVDRWSTENSYDILNYNWNLRIKPIYPLAYFLPLTTAHVQAGVKCGRKVGIFLSPLSGGHSYESVGFGSDFSIIVDMRNMTQMEIGHEDENPIYARIGPGVMVGSLNAFLWRNGGYSFPMGNCFTVAMGGHLIGGGVGYWSTTYGLGIDNVLEYTMVTSRGKVVRASKHHNVDLYWGLRGIGPGGLGIVTEFKVKPFKAKDIKLTFAKKVFPLKEFPKIMDTFQKLLTWAEKYEPTVLTAMYITADKINSRVPSQLDAGITFLASHVYDPEVQPRGNASLLQKLEELFPNDDLQPHFDIPFLSFILATGANPNLPQKMPEQLHQNMNTFLCPTSLAISPMATEKDYLAKLNSCKREKGFPRYFKAKSRFINKLATAEQLQRLGEALKKIPDSTVWILINSEGGAIKKLGNSDTSYVHRDQLYDITLQYEGTDNHKYVKEGMNWIYEFWDLYKPLDGGETYQNYPDKDVTNYLDRFYGSNLRKLKKLKRFWDPVNYFQSFFSIPV